jgi:hypothetical protein
MKNWTIFSFDTTFNFGKYQGNTINQVAKFDFRYILWCIKNIEKFLITEEDLIKCSLISKKTLISVLSKPNEEFINSTDLFQVSDNDIAFLKIKWVEYDEYIDMMGNGEYDYFNDYSDIYSITNNPYYNDSLDMDQQDPEFWDAF